MSEFWIGGHQKKPIKLDINLDEETEEYITALPDKIIVLIKYAKQNNSFSKMVRFIVNNKNEIEKKEYTYPEEPSIIDGDWNAYLAKYTVIPSKNDCINKYDNLNSSFFEEFIYTTDLNKSIDTILIQDKPDLEVKSYKTTINKEGKCKILSTTELKGKVYKILDKALEETESINILGVSPFPVDVFYIGGDRDPEEVVTEHVHYPSDTVFFYAKDFSEYYVICKNEERILGIKRYEKNNEPFFQSEIATKPTILSEEYINWQSPLYNTWKEPDINKYNNCASYLLVDSLKGYTHDPYFSVKQIEINPNKIDFIESKRLDIYQDIKFTNTNNIVSTSKLKDLLLDEGNENRYPYNNISAKIKINKYNSHPEECENIPLPDKRVKLKKLVNHFIHKSQIKIIAASPITSSITKRVRGTSNSSVRIKIRKLSNN